MQFEEISIEDAISYLSSLDKDSLAEFSSVEKKWISGKFGDAILKDSKLSKLEILDSILHSVVIDDNLYLPDDFSVHEIFDDIDKVIIIDTERYIDKQVIYSETFFSLVLFKDTDDWIWVFYLESLYNNESYETMECDIYKCDQFNGLKKLFLDPNFSSSFHQWLNK